MLHLAIASVRYATLESSSSIASPGAGHPQSSTTRRIRFFAKSRKQYGCCVGHFDAVMALSTVSAIHVTVTERTL